MVAATERIGIDPWVAIVLAISLVLLTSPITVLANSPMLISAGFPMFTGFGSSDIKRR